MSERTKAEAHLPSAADWEGLRDVIADRDRTRGLDRMSFLAVQRVREAFAGGAEYVTLINGDQELGRIYADGQETIDLPPATWGWPRTSG